MASQLADVTKKLDTVDIGAASGRMGRFLMPSDKKKDDGKLEQVTRDASRLATEQVKGLATQVVKQLLFNRSCGCGNGGGQKVVAAGGERGDGARGGVENGAAGGSGAAANGSEAVPMET